MTALKTLIAAAAALSLSAPLAMAAPTVLDFNTAPTTYGFGSLVEDGFKVTGSGSYFLSSGGSSYCSPACPNDGSRHLLAQGASFAISDTTGALFTLSSFDGAEAHMGFQSLWAKQIHVVGTKAGGSTVTADFTLDWLQDGDGPGVDFQNFQLSADFSNLSSVVFTGIGGSNNWFTLDNIQLNGLPLAAAGTTVPEPGSLLLCALALGGLAVSRRQAR